MGLMETTTTTTYIERGMTDTGRRVWTAHATADCPGIEFPDGMIEVDELADNTGDGFCPRYCMDDLRGYGNTRRTAPVATDRHDSVDSQTLPPAGPGTPLPPKPEDDGTSWTDETFADAMFADDSEFAHRKFDADDVRVISGASAYALDWLNRYDGDFAFLTDLASKRPTRLTDGQAKGVLNCVRAEVLRNRRQEREAAQAEREAARPDTALDLSGIPAGMYAVPGGDSRLKVRIDNVTKPGKWEGWVFVKDGAEYGSGQKYGSQRPGQSYRGDIADELRIIAADPQAAAAAYGKLVGRCGLCGRVLEDEDSIERGLGPICAAKFA